MDQEILRENSKSRSHFDLNSKVASADSIPLSMINSLLTATTEKEYLTHLAQTAEDLHPEHMRVIIYKLDTQKNVLRKAAAPSLPVNEHISDWGLNIGPALTPSARSVYFDKTVFCGDITKDPSWQPYLADAFKLNLRACWAVPVHSSTREILGTFTFYFDETMTLPSEIPPLIQGFVNIAGLGMEKWNAAKAQSDAIANLKIYEDRLNRALKVRNMGICDFDFQTNKMIWDDAMLQIFGVNRKDFIEEGASWSLRVHPEDIGRVRREVQTAVANKNNFETVFRIFRGDEVRYLKSSGTISFTEGDLPHRLIGLVWDITEKNIALKKLEVERTKAIASAKMASLGEMASSIAHEINNPLTIILNRASHLREKIDANKIDPAGTALELTKVEESVGRISKIIRGLNAFSRNSESDPMIECSLQSIVSDSFELCRERFAKGGIEIRLSKISENLMIRCRPSQISQVLINLINNSYDALQILNEKWLSVEARLIEDKIEISVTDSGTGIPDIVADKIMDPFFTTKDIGHGTGLGLSISKGIIEDHNGKLVYDRCSPNTRFTISLPQAR